VQEQAIRDASNRLQVRLFGRVIPHSDGRGVGGILANRHFSERASMNKSNSIVAIYPSHTAAEEAIKELQQAGYDMKTLSIIGRDYPTSENALTT